MAAWTIGQFSGALRDRPYPGRVRSRLTPPLLLGLAALAFAAAGLVGVAAYWVPAARWIDGNSLGGFASLGGSPTINALASVLAHSANTLPFALATLILLVTALRVRGPRRVASVAVLLTGANVTCALVKPNLFPARDTGDWTHIPHIPVPSFPSGHATASMSLALAAVLVAPAAYRALVSGAGVLYTVGVGLALPILIWHYPSDVAGGYLLAGAWSLIAVAAERAAAQRWPEPGTIRSAARQAIAPPSRAALGVLVALAAALAVIVGTPRASAIAAYADAHTTVVLVAASLAVCAAGVLGAVVAIANRRG
jgi:membrane-associated phospholipid phosphatase